MIKNHNQGCIQSKYDFPPECPTEADGKAWMEFWRYHCGENFRLPTPLGNWVNPSHREWEWFYDKDTDSLLRKSGDLITSFSRKTHSRGRVWSRGQEVDKISGLPASVKLMENGDVRILGTGPIHVRT